MIPMQLPVAAVARGTTALLLSLTALAACRDPAAVDSAAPIIWSDDSIVVTSESLPQAVRELEGLSVAMLSGHLAVVPVRSPGVVVARIPTGEVNEQAVVEGEGPGEVRAPHEVWRDGNQFVVYDIATARLSWFDLRGDSLLFDRAESGMPISSTVAGGPTGNTVFLTPGADHYGLVTCAPGSGTTPLPARRSPRKRGVPDLVAVTSDSLVVIYDGSAGTFLATTCDGQLRFGPYPIPEPLRSALVETNDSLRRLGSEARIDPGPSAKFLAADTDGGILMFYYLPGRAGYGLRLDPRSGRMIRLGGVPDDSAYSGLQKAARAAVDDGMLITTRLGGTHRYHIDLPARLDPNSISRTPETP